MVDTIPVARKRSVTVKEMATSGGAYQSGDVVFLLPTSLISSAIGTPKEGDVVIDRDQVQFTVLSAQGQIRDANGYQRWKLACRNVVIAYDLQDLITIERAWTRLDDSKIEVKTWQTLYEKLPCRVQPTSNDVSDERGIRGDATTYEIPVAQEVDIVVGRDRIVWPGALGGYLEITRYRSRQSIQDLAVIEARAAP